MKKQLFEDPPENPFYAANVWRELPCIVSSTEAQASYCDAIYATLELRLTTM